LFSFNNPQGMCPECHGLGEIYNFDPELLIPDPSKSFQQGCVELVGTWREMGRWRRHIFRGVAETLEHKYGCEPGTILETAWEELDPKLRDPAPATSISPSPGAPAPRATSGAAHSKALSPSSSPNITTREAARSAASSKSTCGSSAASSATGGDSIRRPARSR
jgi:hypothetical protein